MQASSRAKVAALVIGVSIITFGAVGYSAAPASTASTLVNAAPVALDRALDVVEGVPISVVLPAFDPDDDPLEFTIQTTNSGFSALNAATGEFSYTWLPGQTTTVEFSVSDGQLASALATVTIRVRPSGTPVLPMAIVGRPINPRIALVDQATNTVIREIETTFGTGGGNFVAPTRPASIESRTRFLPWRSMGFAPYVTSSRAIFVVGESEIPACRRRLRRPGPLSPVFEVSLGFLLVFGFRIPGVFTY